MAIFRNLLALSALTTFAAAVSAPVAVATEQIAYKPKEIKKCEAIQKRRTNDELNRIYEAAFPAYFEYCAGSVWAQRGAKPGGGFGHAMGIIHGACLAKDANGKNLVL